VQHHQPLALLFIRQAGDDKCLLGGARQL
jgi:hypothetical protein